MGNAEFMIRSQGRLHCPLLKMTLKDAIWNEFTGKYELNVKYHCKGCATDITCDRVLLTSFYLTVPNILVFGIRRRDPESQYANCSRIFQDRLLDLRHSVAGLESSKPLYCQLVGMIVRLGKEADRGDYLCHMMTKDNKVVTVDDNKVTIHSWKKVVEDIQTQRHVQILIYCRTSGELWKSYESSVDSWRVDPTNVFNIKECWIEEKVPTDKRISCADLQSICADSCLNDNVMNSFLQNIIHDIMSKPEGNPKRRYATTSFMMDRLLTGDTQARVVKRPLADLVNQMAKTIIIPIHHKGSPGHWTMAGIYPNAKFIAHCDSLRKESVVIYRLLLSFMLSASSARWKSLMSLLGL